MSPRSKGGPVPGLAGGRGWDPGPGRGPGPGTSAGAGPPWLRIFLLYNGVAPGYPGRPASSLARAPSVNKLYSAVGRVTRVIGTGP